MDDTPRSDTSTTPTGSVREKTGKGVLWMFILVAIAFFVGFFWQFYEATTVRAQLETAEQELAVERLRIHLGQAALAAQAGNYESARQQMSTFFTRLEETEPLMTPEVRSVARNFLSMRDEVITGLSRSNPEYAGVLYGMLETLGNAIDESIGGGPPGAMPTGGGPDAATRPGAGDTGAADTGR